MKENVKQIVASTFVEMAQSLEKGSCSRKIKIALTGMGSELGEQNVIDAASAASRVGVTVYYIGTREAEGVITIKVSDAEEGQHKMEALLRNKEVDGAVTMHYPFPIGVSTIGRVLTPARGKEMFVASTTGTSSTDSVEGMIKNTVAGIITAKACGNENPTVGVLNVDGARQTEIALKKLKENGYDITFADSKRQDGGCIMRGNDVLQGTPDILVCDSLSGNIIVKMLSSFTTGGNFESLGYGYGPSIGESYGNLVMIISRASGTPVIASAIEYAAQLIRGNLSDIRAGEYERAVKAGYKNVFKERRKSEHTSTHKTEVTAPLKEVVTQQIAGIEIMDLEDGVNVLWKADIYAESGMGCTGPIILVSDAKYEKAKKLLRSRGYIE